MRFPVSIVTLIAIPGFGCGLATDSGNADATTELDAEVAGEVQVGDASELDDGDTGAGDAAADDAASSEISDSEFSDSIDDDGSADETEDSGTEDAETVEADADDVETNASDADADGAGGGDTTVEVPRPTFVDISADTGISGASVAPTEVWKNLRCFNSVLNSGGAAAVADFDNDGDEDIFLPRYELPNQLWRNDGNFRFVDVAATVGLDLSAPSISAIWVDLNNDGRLDLVVNTLHRVPSLAYVQQVDGAFSDEAEARGLAISPSDRTCSFLTSTSATDLENDGDLDVMYLRWEATHPNEKIPWLFRNDGNGNFEWMRLWHSGEVFEEAFGFSVLWNDFDLNGFADAYVVSDYGKSQMFSNTGDGPLIEIPRGGFGSEGNGMGSTLGDYDLDGDFDIFVTSIACDTPDITPVIPCSGNRLYRNDGGFSFAEVSIEAGVRESGWGWGTQFFDADNDGDLDLFATGGYAVPFDEPEFRLLRELFQIFATDADALWINQGDGTFVESAQESGLTSTASGRAAVAFDGDADGDLDLIVTRFGEAPLIYRNDLGAGNRWLRISARGTNANYFGVGAVVRVYPGDERQMQPALLHPHTGYLSSTPFSAHFGLGNFDGVVERVEVLFPGREIPIQLNNLASSASFIVFESGEIVRE